MASLLGPNEDEHHVLSVSPCESCQKGKTKWESGRCLTPSAGDMAFIVRAVNSFDAMREALEKINTCIEKHKRFAHLGNGYLEEAQEHIRAALKLSEEE